MGLVIFVVSIFATIGIWRDFVPPEAKKKDGARVLLIVLPIIVTLGIRWLYENYTPQAEAQQILEKAVNAVDEGDTRQAIAILKDANDNRSLWLGVDPDLYDDY